LSEDAKVSIPVTIVTSHDGGGHPTTRLDARIRHCTEEKLLDADRVNLPVSCHGKFDRYPAPSLPRFESMFQVRAELDPYAGSTSCVVERRRGGNGGSISSVGDRQVEDMAAFSAHVVVWATVDARGDLASNEVRLPLYPAFSVAGPGPDRQLVVSNTDTITFMNLTATDEVFNSITVSERFVNLPTVRTGYRHVTRNYQK
jgi:hypothetical protein